MSYKASDTYSGGRMRLIALLVIGGCVTVAAGQTVVYQSGNWSSTAAPVNGLNSLWDPFETSGSVETPGGAENYQRAGDVIRLAPGARTVTQIRLQVGRFGNTPSTGSIDLGLHVYSASGFASNNPTWPGGSLLWEGLVTGVDMNWDSTATNRRRYVTFNLPAITATDELFIAFSAPSVTLPPQVQAGIVASPQSAPSIGTRFSFSQWLQPTGTSTWVREPAISGFPFWALDMQVVAIPTPGTAGLLTFLAACTLRRRRN